MVLRKINAAQSLLTTVLLLDHAIFYSVWMLSRGAIEKSHSNMPWVLAGLVGIHAILSIILMIRCHKGVGKGKDKAYLKLNRATVCQRVTGVLMLLMLGLHIAGAANYFQPKMLHAVLHPLFFAAALAHVAVSVGRAMITLGIGTAKAVKTVDAVMKVICGATFIAGVIGFYLCLFVGVV